MAYIKLELPEDEQLYDGKQITFKAPCNCSEVTALAINGRVYNLVNSMTSNVLESPNVFCANSMLSVLLDVTNANAFVLNSSQVHADFNETNENCLSFVKNKTHGYAKGLTTKYAFKPEEYIGEYERSSYRFLNIKDSTSLLNEWFFDNYEAGITPSITVTYKSGKTATVLFDEGTSEVGADGYKVYTDFIGRADENALSARADLIVTYRDNYVYGDLVLPAAGLYLVDRSSSLGYGYITEVNFNNVKAFEGQYIRKIDEKFLPNHIHLDTVNSLFGTVHVLSVSVARGDKYSSVTAKANLCGNTLHIYVRAVRTERSEDSNCSNEEVCTLTIDALGMIKEILENTSIPGSYGGVATFATIGSEVLDDGTVRVPIHLCASAHVSKEWSFYLTMPAAVDISKF